VIYYMKMLRKEWKRCKRSGLRGINHLRVRNNMLRKLQISC
jgi:hypothetical protein